MNDESTDNSFEVVRQRLKNLRVRYLKRETNKGAQAARNTGIRSAAGNYIAFLDSDDVWTREKLQVQINETNEAAPLRVIRGDAYVVNEKRVKKNASAFRT